MLKCYPVQFQNNLTVSLIVLHCARMSGAAFLLPFEIFFLLLVLLGESWWGGGRGVVELFTHLILKPQKQNLSSTYVMHLFCFFLWSMVCIEWNELVKYCLLSDFFPSPLYQAIMENPLVQLSLNNARILGGMYIRQKLGNSIVFHFALCQFCFSKEVKMWP